MAAIDITTLSGPAQKILDPKSPPPLRAMAAKGIAPGLKPADALAVVVVLSTGEDEATKTIALETLAKLPAPLLNGALGAALHGAVLDAIAPKYAKDLATMEKILQQPNILPETVATVASLGSEAVTELIATNEARLLEHPAIIEKLYMNRATRMSTADRIIELAVRNKVELHGIPAFEEVAQAIANELIPERTDEPTYDDVLFRETESLAESIRLSGEDTHVVDEETGEEKMVDEVLPLHAQLAAMTISQRIRRATLGTSAERLLLVRDTNRLVAVAAVKSPGIQENEIVQISTARNVSDAVLGAIARSKQWSQNHTVKVNLVWNPRTPFIFVSKFIGHLREDELKSLVKSKNVTGAASQAARQQLQRRSK